MAAITMQQLQSMLGPQLQVRLLTAAIRVAIETRRRRYAAGIED